MNGSIQAEIFVSYQNNRRRDISYLVTELLSTEVPSLPPAQPFLRYTKYVVGRRWLIADALVPQGKSHCLGPWSERASQPSFLSVGAPPCFLAINFSLQYCEQYNHGLSVTLVIIQSFGLNVLSDIKSATNRIFSVREICTLSNS